MHHRLYYRLSQRIAKIDTVWRKIMAEHEAQFSEFLTEYRKDGFKHDSYIEIFDALNNGDAKAIEAMDSEIFISGAIGRM